ncbi:hypothetical protein D9M69_561400 [compost metagenome]
MFSPPLPMARETWSGFRNTDTLSAVSSNLTLLILAGLSALEIRRLMLSVHWITSMFSFSSSRTIEWIRDPFIPTHAPTGSIRSSNDSTATLALSPGSLTIFRIEIIPSWISGISSSNNLSRKTGEVRERVSFGFPLWISTL